MFQSLDFIGYDNINIPNAHIQKYKLVDDEIGNHILLIISKHLPLAFPIELIVEFYEKKNLPVAINLARMLFIGNNYGKYIFNVDHEMKILINNKCDKYYKEIKNHLTQLMMLV